MSKDKALEILRSKFSYFFPTDEENSILEAMESYASERLAAASRTGMVGEWQRCPICEGSGEVVNALTTSVIEFTCRTCNGSGIIERPIYESPQPSESPSYKDRDEEFAEMIFNAGRELMNDERDYLYDDFEDWKKRSGYSWPQPSEPMSPTSTPETSTSEKKSFIQQQFDRLSANDKEELSKPMYARGMSLTENVVVNQSPSVAGEADKALVSEDAHEKEVMMHAFNEVRKMFESRSWIMEGRGSYRYDDDRYKEEVRYLYDEFDALQNQTWKNIQSRTFEYRDKIIQQEKDKAAKLVEALKGVMECTGSSTKQYHIANNALKQYNQ